MWHQSDEKHAHAARSVISVTQLDIENGCFNFHVGWYDDRTKC